MKSYIPKSDEAVVITAIHKEDAFKLDLHLIGKKLEILPGRVRPWEDSVGPGPDDSITIGGFINGAYFYFLGVYVRALEGGE